MQYVCPHFTLITGFANTLLHNLHTIKLLGSLTNLTADKEHAESDIIQNHTTLKINANTISPKKVTNFQYKNK